MVFGTLHSESFSRAATIVKADQGVITSTMLHNKT